MRPGACAAGREKCSRKGWTALASAEWLLLDARLRRVFDVLPDVTKHRLSRTSDSPSPGGSAKDFLDLAFHFFGATLTRWPELGAKADVWRVEERGKEFTPIRALVVAGRRLSELLP
jgi:hypothetical protein